MKCLVAPLGDVCTKIGSGATPRGGNKSYRQSGITLVRSMNIHNGRFKRDHLVFIDESQAAKLKNVELEENDVLLNITGASVARCCMLDNSVLPGRVNQHVCILRPGQNTLNNQYLMRFLTSELTQRELLRIAGTGATREAITKADIEKFQIPLPPLTEQKRIAAILDAADALRDKRREYLAQLDTLLQSTFLDMFGDPVTNPMGWEVTTLPDIAAKFTDGPFGSNLKSSHYFPVGVRVIRLQNIGVGEMLDDDLAFISTDHFASLPRNHCKPGDVIIGTLGDPNLRACIVPPRLKESLNKADCVLMRFDSSKAVNTYVCWLLNCSATVAKALELVRGQTRGRISMGRLKELQVVLPPLSLQWRFAAVVESVERQKVWMRAHLAELNALFASLQSRAFKGEL